MNLTLLDWIIVFGVLAVIVAFAVSAKKYTKSVADFLSANRCAGRYLLCTAGGMAGLGAISIIATMEATYKAGFPMSWWAMMATPMGLITALAGFVVYRYRETRVLTMGQFLELRYSKGLRIFASFIAWSSGIINFGIFPAVGTRFVIYFCGLPETVPYLNISTYVVVMVFLLGMSLFFVFLGGQITVMVTDFVQGIFANIAFLIILLWIIGFFNWSTIIDTLKMAPPDASLINPFHTSEIKDFNYFYFIIALLASIYGFKAWQGTQGYNSSAKSAHEAKMAGIISEWRGYVVTALLLLLPIGAYVVMNNSQFADTALEVNQSLEKIENETVRGQMIVPVVLSRILPRGLAGLFCAVMLAAFISTHDTYLHSWGSIFVQDVVMPFRKKPFTPKQHIFILRLSTVFVAVFIFIFSLLYRQNEYILMFFAITGAIYIGGAGSLILGGLYWKRGTNLAAWVAMIIGSSLAFGGLAMRQTWASHMYPWMESNAPWMIDALKHVIDGIATIVPGINWKVGPDEFPISSQWYYFLTIVLAGSSYVVLSLIEWLIFRKKSFNLERLLHRGIYTIKGDHEKDAIVPPTGFRALLPSKEFTRGDKVIYCVKLGWAFTWIAIFVIGTIYNLCFDVSDDSWGKFWFFYICVIFVVAAVTTVWFLWGGIYDMKNLYRRLRDLKRDDLDDGMVVGHHNVADEGTPAGIENDNQEE